MDRKGNPVSDATLMLALATLQNDAKEVDAEGHYRFDDLAGDEWSITIDAEKSLNSTNSLNIHEEVAYQLPELLPKERPDLYPNVAKHEVGCR